MKKIILGISGKKQSGKSSLSSFIKKTYDTGLDNEDEIAIVSFADELKTLLIRLLGLKETQCYGSDEEKNSFVNYFWDNLPDNIREMYFNKVITTESESSGHIERYTKNELRSGPMTARELMQVFGTDIMRNMFDSNVWINATFRAIESLPQKIIIIQDVRFKTEIQKIISYTNGYIIRLFRSVENDVHFSETQLDDFDFSLLGFRCLLLDNTNLNINEKNDRAVDYLNENNIIRAME